MSLESRDNPSGPDLIDPTYIAPAPPTDPVVTTPATTTVSTTITQTGSVTIGTTPTDPSAGGAIPLIPPYSPPSP